MKHVETNNAVEAAILELLKNRKVGASICPSEAARAVFEADWREQMQHVRNVAKDLVEHGKLEICQKGETVNPSDFKGPIRLRLPE